MDATASPTRYRCTSCGNVTRFDVIAWRRSKAYHHYTVGGALAIDDEEILESRVESVVCRWCGPSGQVEVLASGTEGDGS